MDDGKISSPRKGKPSLSKSPIEELPYLWRRHRKAIVAATAGALVLFVVLEVVHQIRIQRAQSYSAEGEYAKAIQSLKGRKFGLFRNGVADAITNRAQYHLSMETLGLAIKQLNWYVAQTNLRTVLECGHEVGTFDEDVGTSIEAWRDGLLTLVSQGEMVKCRGGLDSLLAVDFEGSTHAEKLESVSYEVSLALLRGYLEAEAWTEALKAVEKITEHEHSTPEVVSQLNGLVHERMRASLEHAVSQKEYVKAEALLRLIDSHFPEADAQKGDILAKLHFSKALSAGAEFEQNEAFDKALESYDRALRMRPGSSEAFAKLAALRERLRGYARQDGRWTPLGPGGPRTELQEAAAIASRGYRRLLYTGRSRQPVRIVEQSLYAGKTRGSWSLTRVEADGRAEWVFKASITAPSSTWSNQSRAYSGFKLGLLLVDANNRPLKGKVIEVPLMLQGETRTVEARLPSHADEDALRYAVTR